MDNTNNGTVDMLDEGMLSKAALAAGALTAKPVTKTVKRAAKAINNKVGEASDKAKTAIGNVATGGNYGKVKEHTKGYNDDTSSAAIQDLNSKYYRTQSAEERKAADASREKVKKLEAAKKQYEATHHTTPAPKPKSLLGVIKTAIGTDNSNRRKIADLQSDIKKTTTEADTHSKKSTQLINASTKAKEDAARLRNRAEQHRVANNAAVTAGKKQLMLRSSGAGALAGAAIGGIKGAMDVKKLKNSGADEEAIRQAKKDAVKKAAIGAGAGLAIGAGGGYAGASKFGKKHTIGEAAMVAAIRTLQESLTSEEYAVIMDEATSLVESGITTNNADAIKFIASKHLDEASYAIVEAVMDEAVLNENMFSSPLRSHLAKLKEIKDAKPKDYDGPEVAKKFIDANYDELVKTARLLEKEPSELRRNDIAATIGIIVTWIGGYAAIMTSITAGPALFVGGVVAMMLSVVIGLIDMVIGYLRTGHDRDAADQLAKIRRALKKIDLKKLPESHRRKIEDCLEAIDDAETAISARIKVANENANVMAAIWGTDNDN